MKRSYIFYVSCILIAAGLWGVVGLFLKGLLALGLTRYQVVFLRMLLAAVLFGGFVLAKTKRLPTFRLRDIWCFIGTGIFNQLFFCLCYYTAIPMIGVSVASVLMYTSPVFAILLSAVLFREKINSRTVMALLLALSGCVLVSGVVGGAHALPLAGILLGLGSGLTYAFSGIFNKFALQRGYSSETISFYTFVFCALGAAPLAFMEPFPALGGMELALTGGNLFGMALLCGIFPTFLYATGLKGVSPGRASLFTSSEPAVATLLGVLVLHEELTLLMIVGILLIVSVVILLSKEGGSAKEDAAA